MQIKEFLQHVWSEEGWYCIINKDGKAVTPVFLETIDDAVNEVNKQLSLNRDVYFACSTFKEGTEKTQDNVKEEKILWLDIDCGRDEEKNKWKDYRTKEDGLKALRKFTDQAKLPEPTIIDSGNGIHCYWPFTHPVPKAAWQPVAEGLKFLCEKYEFKADRACTSDSSRMLRVPNTKNFKDRFNPKDVVILNQGTPTSFDEIASYIPIHLVPKPRVKKEMNEATKLLMENSSSSFIKIINRCRNNDGCAQLMHIATKQKEIEEPLWRSGLSIAAFCEDSDTAIHTISKHHPGYDFNTTEDKANRIPAPHTCREFENKRPEGCKDCKHKGKITSPIQLGRVIARARGADNIVTAKSYEFGEELKYEIPDLPHPYFRGKNGGIYKSLPDESDNGIQIYEHDFYLVDRMHDSVTGEMCWFKVHLPQDGVREFIAPLATVLAKDKARDLIVSYGIVCYGKQLDNLMAYIADVVRAKQKEKSATHMYKQYGWNKTFNKILIGNREIDAYRSTYVPVSTDLDEVNSKLHKQGTYELWKEAISVYERPGMELRAFGFFCAFGSLLMPLFGGKEQSAVVSFYNPKTGQGKTSILQAMTSVYGDPNINAKLINVWGDTQNSVVNRLGYMNNLPTAVDEFTDVTADDLHEFLKFVSMGRGKNRLGNGINKERANNTTFNLICVLSSNTDFRTVILSKKAQSSGEMARFIQFKIDKDTTLNKEDADVYFDKMMNNYGHAGEIWAEYLIRNLPRVRDLLKQMQLKIDKEYRLEGEDRKYSVTLAAVFLGATLAKKLGIHNIDIGPVYEAVHKALDIGKQELIEKDFNPIEILSTYLRLNFKNTLVINSKVDSRSGLPEAPIQKPIHELAVRIEPDTQTIYIPNSAMTDYLKKIGIELKDFLTGLRDQDILLPSSGKLKSLHKGLETSGPQTRCLWISSAKFEDIGVEDGV